MHCIEIPKEIDSILSLFYYVGLWHRGEKATVRETRIKFFYFFYHLLFTISLMGGIQSDKKEESIFLTEVAIASAVLSVKLFYIIWRKDQIIEMLTRIGVYSVENREEFTLANDKLKRFLKFVKLLLILVVTVGVYVTVVFPICGQQKNLFFNVAFPLDWKNNKVAFWLANAFIFAGVILTIITFLFSVIIWYLMINCALRYEILGREIRNMGIIRTTNETVNKRRILQVEKQNLFIKDLIASIDSHQNIRELIHQLEFFLSNVFFIRIVTSGLCICGSTYCLAFNVGENFVEHLIHLVTLVYNVSEIFMIMYFGNEIKLSSDRLSYCLFESNWIDQPPATKKFIIIFGELLKQPHEIVIGTLYPLTLEMFRKILNFAYDTFNILKNIK